MADEGRISAKKKNGLILLAKMDNSVFNNMFKVLSGLPFTLKRKDIASKISESIKDIPVADIESILSAAISTIGTKENGTDSIEIVVKNVIEIVKEEVDDPKITPTLEKTLTERLLLLTKCEQLHYSYKGIDLITEQENLFMSVQITDDIRPVFLKDGDSLPKGAFINHILRIHYHKSGEHKDIFIALDKNDIENMKQQIEKSQIRTKAIEGIIDNLGISNITRDWDNK